MCEGAVGPYYKGLRTRSSKADELD
jgi:hypothetical protein